MAAIRDESSIVIELSRVRPKASRCRFNATGETLGSFPDGASYPRTGPWFWESGTSSAPSRIQGAGGAPLRAVAPGYRPGQPLASTPAVSAYRV